VTTVHGFWRDVHRPPVSRFGRLLLAVRPERRLSPLAIATRPAGPRPSRAVIASRPEKLRSSRFASAAALGSMLIVRAALAAQSPSNHTFAVCGSAVTRGDRCDFSGDGGIQAAVDRASNGDTILIKAGRYAPASYRDLPFNELTIRSYIVVDGKNLTIAGESGTVLDGSTQRPATAIAIRNADVTLRNLEITGFRYDVEEDNIYDGHGVFAIDSRLRIDNVTIRKFQKMGLTGAGSSILDVSHLQVLDGHVAIWLRETAYLRLTDSIIRGNDSAALAAYDNSVAHTASSIFEDNRDDGLYTENQAVIFATGAKILRNKPIAAHATGGGRIWIGDSTFAGNAKNVGAEGKAEVLLGANVTEK
jgi:hypothetical protein